MSLSRCARECLTLALHDMAGLHWRGANMTSLGASRSPRGVLSCLSLRLPRNADHGGGGEPCLRMMKDETNLPSCQALSPLTTRRRS